MSEYYTARKAQEVLGGIHNTELLRYVANGKIKRYVPSGKKRGYYLKKDVDTLAEELHVEREDIRIIDKDTENDRRIIDRARGSPLIASR